MSLFLLSEANEACYTILGVIYFLRELLKVACIIIPIGVIVMTGIDFFKGVINFGDNPKIINLVTKRLIYMVIIFLIPYGVYTLFDIFESAVNDKSSFSTSESSSCWNYASSNSVSDVKELVEAREDAIKEIDEKIRLELINKVGTKNNALAEKMANSKISVKDKKYNDNGSSSSSSSSASSDGSCNNKTKVRLTCFDDPGTSSGVYTSSSKVSKNDKGWYFYEEEGEKYLAVATANKKAGYANSNSAYNFSNRDKITLEIDGKVYKAIVLDVCGACADYDGLKIDLWMDSNTPNFGDYQYLCT